MTYKPGQHPQYIGGFHDALKDRDRTDGLLAQAEEERAAGIVRMPNGVFKPSEDSGVLITVTQPDDPAMALLKNPLVFSTPTVYKRGCYICEDPEMAAMGLPLCFACEFCGEHVAADDGACSCDMGHFPEIIWHWERNPEWMTSPHLDLSVDECWPQVLKSIYIMKACPDCGELNPYGTSCDRTDCPNYGGTLVVVRLKVVS